MFPQYVFDGANSLMILINRIVFCGVSNVAFSKPLHTQQIAVSGLGGLERPSNGRSQSLLVTLRVSAASVCYCSSGDDPWMPASGLFWSSMQRQGTKPHGVVLRRGLQIWRRSHCSKMQMSRASRLHACSFDHCGAGAACLATVA